MIVPHVVAINQHPTVFSMSQTPTIHHTSAWRHPRTVPLSSLFLNDFSQEKVSSPQSLISYVFKLQFLAPKRMPTDIHDVRLVNNWTFFRLCLLENFFRRSRQWKCLRGMCWHLHLTLEWKVIVIWKLMLQNWPGIGQSWHAVYCHPDTNRFFFFSHPLHSNFNPVTRVLRQLLFFNKFCTFDMSPFNQNYL